MNIHHTPHIKFTWLAILTGILIISCSMQKSQAITQGIEGQITRMSGNQMPMKGKPQSKGKGIAAEIFIYTATTLEQTEGQTPLFTNIKTKQVAQLKSDSTGHFQISLPVGVYSVFVKVNKQFFAAETDGDILNPAVVQSGKVTQRNITVNIGAAY